MAESTRPKPSVFVVMPFAAEFDDVYSKILEACEDAGAYAKRIMPHSYNEPVPQQIVTEISKADVIVADVTKELKKDGKSYNANVYYEVGYAHALNKPVVFLTQDDLEHLPFDTQNHFHIPYDRMHLEEMKQPLEEQVRPLVDRLGEAGASGLSRVEFYVRGKRLREVLEVQSRHVRQIRESARSIVTNVREIVIDAINPVGQRLKTIQFKVALAMATPSVALWCLEDRMMRAQVPDVGFVHTSPVMHQLLPGESRRLYFFFRNASGSEYLPPRVKTVLRCMTDWGFDEYSFVVKLMDEDEQV